ncbi:AAA family ATPase [uncultured Methylobacterium sp.]|uniref:ATP-binding protein n=1 Tax=uncultured Methylobacterium sp. TaxID=157278 RepID=UPI0035C9AD63
MRLLSLDLERYGPFTAKRVEFRPDARLHVVLGANEAGKSSALAAVTDLLFGIEARTAYAFLHEMPQMRIGAEIRAADGRGLSFRRRKGNRNTLVDAGDAALSEIALAPFLGGLTREVFCRAFGLDAGSLRAGAREMLNVDGELGASLFAAASGLRGYGTLQKALDEESDRIFAPRASQKRSFYQALDRYEEARRAIRETGLRAGDWRELNEEIAAAGHALDAIRAERTRIAAEQARLARLRRVGPLIAEIDAAAERGRVHADLPEASDSWIDRLGAGLRSVEAAAIEEARTAALLAEATADLAALSVDAAPIARTDAIEAAYRGIARFDKDGLDLPRLQAEADGFARDLDHLAVRIGVAGGDALKAGQPSDATSTRIEGLIRTGRELAAGLGRLRQELSARRAEHARLRTTGPAETPPVDPAPLRSDLKAFLGLHGEVARRDDLDRTVRREAGLLWMQAARLSPPVSDLAALMQAGLPSHAAIARFRRDLEALERNRDRATDRHAAALHLVAETEARLRRREAGRPIPSRADLLALRIERDGLLDPLRALGPDPSAPGAAEALSRYVAAVGRADRAADALVADAARAAEQAADRARLEAEQAEAEALGVRLAEAEASLDAAEAGWRACWAAAGIAPAPPAEMAAWLTEVETLFESQQAIEAQSIEQVRIAARVERFRAPLADLALRAGLADLAGLDVGLGLARLEERIAALSADWDANREVQARAAALAEQIARIEAELSALQAREGAWREAWTGAVSRIGLAPGADPEEADSALAAWRAVPTVLTALERQQRRIDGLRRDMEAYRADVEDLAVELAPDLGALPTTAAMKALHGRLQDALKGESRRAELGRRRAAVQAAHAAAVRTAARAREGLAEHVAGTAGAAEPAVLHERLVARRSVQAELHARRAELARAADGIAEATLRAELAASDPDAIEAALRSLSMADDDLDQRGKAAFADRDRGERRREVLEGGTGAERALAQRRAAEAELRAAARQYAVLKLASLLLGTAIGRQRAGQQDPLLMRAGAVLAALTGGAFAGLAQEYDADDKALIVARRASGQTVHVDGLSEGTRDQLYLALRLAYLEDYAARAEPAPFIGDDLFSTFDDARTAHGLEALASIGGTVQPILFTHHRHVADLARARLGEAVDVLNL